MDFVRPRVLVSGCIESERCAHNGLMVESETVRILRDYADCTDMCPETGIRLSVPRSPLLLRKTPEGIRLIQSGSGIDMTSLISAWSDKALAETDIPDGIILKFRSATCGNRDVRIYPSSGKDSPLPDKGTGIFAQAVLAKYSHLPITTEAHLRNPVVREHFLTALFASASLRMMKFHRSRAALQEFHARHKLLLMAWDEKSLRILGPIAADTHRPFKESIQIYNKIFLNSLKIFPKPGSHINVLSHVLGFFSRAVTPKERLHFLETLEHYRKKELPLGVCLSLARSFIEEHDIEYLREQAYFNPFPDELKLFRDDCASKLPHVCQ